MHVSQRIQQMAESQTLAMAQLSRDMKAQGFDIVNLSIGQPDFNTPDFIKEAAKKAIDENYSFYPPVAGYPELRQAICDKFKRDNKLEYLPENIVVSTGAKQSLMNTIMSLVNHGDEVILPAPYWVSYHNMVDMAGGTVVSLPTTIATDFKITPQQLANAISPKTKLMVFSSPCNPSGSVYTIEELNALSEVILQHEHLYVISDEIYEHINFTGEHASLGAINGMSERVITVNGLAKGFAMTGWRLGYIGAPKWIADACIKYQGQYTSGANTIAQRAAIAALKASPKEVVYMAESYQRRRDFMFNELQKINGLKINKPTGAFYLFPDVTSFFGKSYNGKTINDANELCLFLLEEGHVATVTGEAFGNKDCIRLSYATSDELLAEAAKRITHTLNKLQ